MSADRQMLEMIAAARGGVGDTLARWSAINSGSLHLQGVRAMADEMERDFAVLGVPVARVKLPPAELIGVRGELVQAPLGPALHLRQRPDAPAQVLLGIHYDTVFAADHPFQTATIEADGILRGPGVCDAKGGILVLLLALQAFERHPAAAQLGWEVVLNPDEELGSPGSADLLGQVAGRHRVALLFEPALPDGALVGARRGSGNFTVVVRGRAAHSGRDFASGRSAVLALAELLLDLDQRARTLGGEVTVNSGRIEGGDAPNVVPALAIARCNCRVGDAAEIPEVERVLRESVATAMRREGISAQILGGFSSRPKVVDQGTARLLALAVECGQELGTALAVKPSGGASDGNRLAAGGLAVLDSLGPVGDGLHSEREHVKLDSVIERAALTALLLTRIAHGAFA